MVLKKTLPSNNYDDELFVKIRCSGSTKKDVASKETKLSWVKEWRDQRNREGKKKSLLSASWVEGRCREVRTIVKRMCVYGEKSQVRVDAHRQRMPQNNDIGGVGESRTTQMRRRSSRKT